MGICVAGHTPLTNLAALGERFGHDAEEEVWTALTEIAAIVRVQMKGWQTSAAWTYQGYGGTVSRSVPIHRRSAMRVRDGRVLKRTINSGDAYISDMSPTYERTNTATLTRTPRDKRAISS